MHDEANELTSLANFAAAAAAFLPEVSESEVIVEALDLISRRYSFVAVNFGPSQDQNEAEVRVMGEQ